MSIPAVSKFMTPQPFWVERTASLEEAHQMMRKYLVRHLPVLEQGSLVGIVTQRDLYLIETLDGADLADTAVEEAMTEHPFIVTSDTALDEVLDIMAEHGYGCAIVVGREGVEGIFTATDACRAFAKMLRAEAGIPEEAWRPSDLTNGG